MKCNCIIMHRNQVQSNKMFKVRLRDNKHVRYLIIIIMFIYVISDDEHKYNTWFVWILFSISITPSQVFDKRLLIFLRIFSHSYYRERITYYLHVYDRYDFGNVHNADENDFRRAWLLLLQWLWLHCFKERVFAYK